MPSDPYPLGFRLNEAGRIIEPQNDVRISCETMDRWAQGTQGLEAEVARLRDALETIAEEAMQVRHYKRPLDPLWVETTARNVLSAEAARPQETT